MSIIWDDDKKDQLLKLLNEKFYFHKDGTVTRRLPENMEDLNREMVVADFQGTAPSCYLFCNGAAMYFDEAGNQIHDFQCYGMTALKRFVERYPEAPVHWALWRKGSQIMTKESIQDLIRIIKEDVHIGNQNTEETT